MPPCLIIFTMDVDHTVTRGAAVGRVVVTVIVGSLGTDSVFAVVDKVDNEVNGALSRFPF